MTDVGIHEAGNKSSLIPAVKTVKAIIFLARRLAMANMLRLYVYKNVSVLMADRSIPCAVAFMRKAAR